MGNLKFMKKYSEQLLLLSFAAMLHFSFDTHRPVIADKEPAAAPSLWSLNAEQLKGDTLIHVAYDPFFKKDMSYKAFPLKENLMMVMGEQEMSPDMQVIFHCTDGYRPHMPLQQVLKSNGFLAYRDVSLEEGQEWADSLSSKFSPFYLVWPEADHNDKTFATPYGLASIELKPASVEFSAALPDDDTVIQGFELFSNTCMRCHSMNKVGGSMAPELNYPKNITEYWTKENIWAFIQAPTSFRFNSKMPPMTAIDEAEFEKIYDYLVAMKDIKRQ